MVESGNKVLVIGATSGIAEAVCRLWASRGVHLLLAARNAGELGRMAADLRVRFDLEVLTEPFDAARLEEIEPFVERCLARLDHQLDGVLICHGVLPDAEFARRDGEVVRQTIDLNFTSVAVLLTHWANFFENRRAGWIAVISSVAGDRGRQSNYLYGSTKAAISAFLQGLRNRLHSSGIHVLTIKPGFVDTPMTSGRINPHSPLVASPERVARDIDRALSRRKDILYTPWFWSPIMALFRGLPESIFKRLRL